MGAALPLLRLATGDGRAAGLTRGGVVLTVNADRDVVERQLGGGELACPSCGGVLARWGNGAQRRVRLPGGRRAGRVVLPAQVTVPGVRGDACAAAGVVPGPAGRCRRGDRARAGGEGGRGRAPGDRGAAGPPGLDGAGLAAGVHPAGGAGPVGVHRAGGQPGDRSAAAGPGGIAGRGCGGGGRGGGCGGGPGAGGGRGGAVGAGGGGDVRAAAGPVVAGRVANTSWLWAAPR